jgi:hypothetical protein
MKYTYQRRVEKYLTSKYEQRIKAKYVNQMRETYMMQRIEGIKEQRADNHCLRSMVFKCFAALYDYK